MTHALARLSQTTTGTASRAVKITTSTLRAAVSFLQTKPRSDLRAPCSSNNWYGFNGRCFPCSFDFYHRVRGLRGLLIKLDLSIIVLTRGPPMRSTITSTDAGISELIAGV